MIKLIKSCGILVSLFWFSFPRIRIFFNDARWRSNMPHFPRFYETNREFFLCCVGMTCPLTLLGWSQDQTVGGGSGGKDPSYGRFCIRIQPFVLGPDRPIGGE